MQVENPPDVVGEGEEDPGGATVKGDAADRGGGAQWQQGQLQRCADPGAVRWADAVNEQRVVADVNHHGQAEEGWYRCREGGGEYAADIGQVDVGVIEGITERGEVIDQVPG